jgi:hypothetical protein
MEEKNKGKAKFEVRGIGGSPFWASSLSKDGRLPKSSRSGQGASFVNIAPDGARTKRSS